MKLGRWRIRLRYHCRKQSAAWVDRTVYPEGTVYRAAVGLLQMTVMVDRMTDAERQTIADQLQWFVDVAGRPARGRER
jgi:hypothetical protein